jgi:serine palmitoyltransferase
MTCQYTNIYPLLIFRGFYGTIQPHLDFERDLAKFMGVPEAISYSDSASAVSSAITAFAKRGDLLLVDEACNEAIRTGIYLSRATVQTYKHNDMKDLEGILASIASDDRKKKRDATQQRRFIVTEGLFRNTGDVCPLPDILALKEKFCYRLIMDESTSFGVLGKTGRGCTEHFNLSIDSVEIITLAMDTVLASVGGVCIGTREIVDHQRLSGAGYCFSAASPPFLSSAGSYV